MIYVDEGIKFKNPAILLDNAVNTNGYQQLTHKIFHDPVIRTHNYYSNKKPCFNVFMFCFQSSCIQHIQLYADNAVVPPSE